MLRTAPVSTAGEINADRDAMTSAGRFVVNDETLEAVSIWSIAGQLF
jgi:hypothetical protein